MKKKLACVSDNKVFRKNIEIDEEQGRHQLGLCIGKRNYSKEGDLEILLKISEDEFEKLIKQDKAIRELSLTHHTDERGLFDATWYFVMYEDRESSYFKPTRLNIDYDKEITVEIIVSVPELPNYFTRIYEYKYKTSSCYTTHMSNLDLEDIFKELLENDEQGLHEDGQEILAELFDSVGSKQSINFECIDELVDNVVSFRII